jgi:prolyl-tRNA synthetase
MLLSRYFLPTLKENPLDAHVVSHQLMIRAGMIRQTASGIYSWLPLGLKVLRKVENIIKKQMDLAGACEILMPTIQPAELWLESGRYNDYGKEMLRITDRHDRALLYGPTHEEVVTDLFRKNVFSYKDLPKNLYQIHWKFRDEVRPRFGLMRGREFLMKDAYSFDINFEESKATYNLMYSTYFKIFQAMGLKPIALKAETGAIGGDLSHEFHILAETGESAIFYDKKFDEISQQKNINIADMQQIYAMADDLHIPEKCPVAPENLMSKRGIEVGHIFNFGIKYSKAMQATVLDQDGKKVYPYMGSYGIGVSRVVAACIEANHDSKGIIWPKEIAPFEVVLVNLKPNNQQATDLCLQIYHKLQEQNIEVLFDDTKNSLGQKLAIADLIGVPTQILVSDKYLDEVEVKNRLTQEKQLISINNLLQFLKA